MPTPAHRGLLARRAASPRRVLPTRLLLPTLALALLASGCGGSDAGEEEAAPSQAAASPSTDLPSGEAEVPEGVTLTEPGTELDLGETATVLYEPNSSKSSVIEMTVTKVQAGRIADLSAFQLDAETKKSAPYYATVRVENVGSGDLGGAAVPLFAVAEDDSLVQPSSFTSAFERCPSTSLPDEFGEGEKTTGCLVYLIQDGGEPTATSFRPLQSQEPVTWTGKIRPAAKPGRGR